MWGKQGTRRDPLRDDVSYEGTLFFFDDEAYSLFFQNILADLEGALDFLVSISSFGIEKGNLRNGAAVVFLMKT